VAESSVALVAKMEVRLRDMEKQLAKAGQMADKSVSQIEKKFASANLKLPPGLSALQKGLAGAFAGVAIEQFISAGRQAIATLADMADEAERIGTSTTFLQQFAYAVQLAGGNSEEASSGLEKFARQLSQAGTGAGELAKVFEENGIAIKNAKGELISVEDALKQYADLVQNAANPQDQLNLAAIAFGKSAGPAMVNALKDGSAGLSEMAAEASRTGGVIDSEVIARAAELDDKFTALEISASNWAKSLAVAIADFAIPQLEDLIKTINTVINLLGTSVSAYAANPALETAKAQLKAGAAQKLGGTDQLSQFYNAMGDQFEAERLHVDIRKPTRLPSAGGGGGGGRRGGGGKTEHDYAKEVLEDLRLELEKTQAIGDARDAILLKEETLSQIRRANVEAASAEGLEIQNLVKAIDDAKKAADTLIENLDNVRDIASTGLDSFVSGLLNGKSAVDSLNDALENMLSTIASIAEQQIIESLFGKSGTAGTGGLGGLLSGLFGGARAGGGSVQSGRAYLVGERGPELMVPHMSGTVVPANMASGGSGVQVVINNNAGADVSTKQSRSSSGTMQIDVMIDKVAASKFATPGSEMNRTAKGIFGLQQGLTRR